MHRHVFKLCGDQDTLRIRHWNEEFEYHRKQPLAKLEFADYVWKLSAFYQHMCCFWVYLCSHSLYL
ncbi:hypothetical protein ES319_D11G280300v1 [Gossypium barbadense]|uniref:Uncharacterized protein n=2 Tax=Gossypium TaxID=3633 RepID=A0A5J5PFY6_GOSBA|nr:hypothetical protein ES319_D11G280300v1 [Gossypium barbadense]